MDFFYLYYIMIIYNFIKYLILFLREKKLIEGIYNEEHLIVNLSELFGITFKKDWIGRLYAIFNPLVNTNPNDVIFENLPQGGYSLEKFVEKWIMDKMNIAQTFMINKGLFEILTYHLELLDENQNYLFTIEPITWFDFKKWMKRFVLTYGILFILIIILLLVF